MDPVKTLGSSLEIIKMLYETAETYRKLERINKNILNEFTLLISLKDQIQNSRRTENNPVIDNYLIDIKQFKNKLVPKNPKPKSFDIKKLWEDETLNEMNDVQKKRIASLDEMKIASL